MSDKVFAMSTEQACIYVTGSDMSLREAGWHLIDRGIALRVEMLEAGTLYVNEAGKRKTSASGRALLILIDGARLNEAIAAIHDIHGPGAEGFALPVLAHF